LKSPLTDYENQYSENIANKITGFELEADDYIMKPFSPKELEKRIKSALIKFQLSQSKEDRHSNNILYKSIKNVIEKASFEKKL
jgi:DNA-binding response OmpR family regulator